MSRSRTRGPALVAALLAFATTTLSACGGDARATTDKAPTSHARGGNLTDLSTTKEAAGAPGADREEVPWPARSMVGVPKGTKLTKSGPLRIRQDGTVVDAKEVRGEISISANNVTVRNTHVIGAGEWGIIQRKGYSGLRVETSEINGDGHTKMQVAILNYGGALTVRNSYIHTASDGIDTPHGLIERNVIRYLKYFPGDHNDGIASPSGPGRGLSLVIRRNVVLNPLSQTSAIALFQDFGRAHDVTIEQNLLAGGGYALYGGKGRYGQPTNIRIVGNTVSRSIFLQGGYYGPVAKFDSRGAGNVWRDNVWADTGRPIQP